MGRIFAGLIVSDMAERTRRERPIAATLFDIAPVKWTSGPPICALR
jgi:hypothetical protein